MEIGKIGTETFDILFCVFGVPRYWLRKLLVEEEPRVLGTTEIGDRLTITLGIVSQSCFEGDGKEPKTILKFQTYGFIGSQG